MKILVIGGTGRIGSKVVARLRDQGHEAIAAAPATGVDILSGAGLDAAMSGVRVVVDLANSSSRSVPTTESVRLPPVLVQPIASEDVAEAVAHFAAQPPAGASSKSPVPSANRSPGWHGIS